MENNNNFITFDGLVIRGQHNMVFIILITKYNLDYMFQNNKY